MVGDSFVVHGQLLGVLTPDRLSLFVFAGHLDLGGSFLTQYADEFMPAMRTAHKPSGADS